MMMRKHAIWIFIIAVVLVPLTLFAIVKWTENTFQNLPILPDKQHTIGTFRVTDQKGNTIGNEVLKGRISVVNFFFTKCPVVCPKMINQLKRVQAYSNVKDFSIYSFSVDPVRDSVSRLKDFSDKMSIGGNWHLLTGSKIDIYRLGRKGFNVVATDGDGGETDFIHSELFVLLDKDSRIRGYYNGTEKDEVDGMIRDMKKLE
jgi:protein SCO1